MKYFDCNIHLDQFKSPNSIINEYHHFNVKYLITLCDNIESYYYLSQIIKGKQNIYIGLGLHPNRTYSAREKKEMLNLIEHEINIIGECGLDYWNKTNSIKTQTQNLISQIELAEKYNKTVILHVRKAERELLDILNTFKLNKVIIHWYSGTVKDLHQFIKNNYYFSYNICINLSKKYQNIISQIPLNQLLLESDAPYLFSGILTRPEDFQKIVSSMARIKNFDEVYVLKILNKNFKSIFLKNPTCHFPISK